MCSALFEHLGLALLVLDPAGRVLAKNASAVRVLADASALRLTEEGHLQAALAPENRRLQALIRRAAQDDVSNEASGDAPEGASLSGVCVHTLALHHPKQSHPLCLDVLPLKSDATQAASSRIAILLRDPGRRRVVHATFLREHYGLTPREIQLCAAIFNGSSLAQFAEQQGLACETVRGYRKTAMKKMNVRKQAQWMQLLVSLEAGFSFREPAERGAWHWTKNRTTADEQSVC